ncbi:hypothetical protein [Kushneria phosphatilytica]|uniref:Uncharacterized protein n=1 Tax=Kushneria phosphatilytica TaxID=657387 RepID=A0A1S1NQX1_9GAMM|nr:hypothetical protein [Kushneria phosphatilytica]OHV11189.1 hypothetical protein BH688_07650 [Kushneria phosphatilytica]QEL12241.1 hypothetical protein FY550_14585 [Kushneria phosphatilytica]
MQPALELLTLDATPLHSMTVHRPSWISIDRWTNTLEELTLYPSTLVDWLDEDTATLTWPSEVM